MSMSRYVYGMDIMTCLFFFASNIKLSVARNIDPSIDAKRLPSVCLDVDQVPAAKL